jgi:hypothetical protein
MFVVKGFHQVLVEMLSRIGNVLGSHTLEAITLILAVLSPWKEEKNKMRSMSNHAAKTAVANGSLSLP